MAGQDPIGSTVTDYDGWTWQQIKQAIVGGGADVESDGGAADPTVSSPASFTTASTAFNEARTQFDDVYDRMRQWMGNVFGANGSYQGDAADTLEQVLTEFVNWVHNLANPVPAYSRTLQTAGESLQRAIDDILKIDRAAALATVANWQASKGTQVPNNAQQPPPPYQTGGNGDVIVDVSTDPAVAQQLTDEMRQVINRLAGVYRQSVAALRPPMVDTRTGATGTDTGPTGQNVRNRNAVFDPTASTTDGTGAPSDQPPPPAGTFQPQNTPDNLGQQTPRAPNTPTTPNLVFTPNTSTTPSPLTTTNSPTVTSPPATPNISTGSTSPVTNGAAVLVPPMAPMTSGMNTSRSIGAQGKPGGKPTNQPADSGLSTAGGFLNLPQQQYVDMVKGPNQFDSTLPPNPQDPPTRLAQFTAPAPTLEHLTLPQTVPGDVGQPAGPATFSPMYPFVGMGMWPQTNQTHPPARRLVDVQLNEIRPSDLGLGDVKVTDVRSGGPVLTDLERHGQAAVTEPHLAIGPDPRNGPNFQPLSTGEHVLSGPLNPAGAVATSSALARMTSVGDGTIPGDMDAAGMAGMPPMFLGSGVPGHGEHGYPQGSWLQEYEDVWSGHDERDRTTRGR